MDIHKDSRDCQYLRKRGDAPGWCKEADHPCPLEIGDGECLIEDWETHKQTK